ncbi:MAG: hypothetical protein ACFCGT_27670 [Sandaracinaceae bacterium]
MTQDRIEAARTQFVSERPLFEEVASQVQDELHAALTGSGVRFRLESRAKDAGSLLKKLLTNSEMSYQQMRDRAGARIIVAKLSDVETVETVLKERVPKIEAIPARQEEVDRFGFRARFFSVKRAPLSDANGKKRRCEIQLVTEVAAVWASLSHRYVYKTAEWCPREVHRAVSRLSALMEVVDHEIERIDMAVRESPDGLVARAYLALEAAFLRFRQPSHGQQALSLRVLEALRPAFETDYERWESGLPEFVESNSARLERALAACAEQEQLAMFDGQPETIAVLRLLDEKPMFLEELWPDWLGESALERLQFSWRGKVAVV